MQSIKISQVWSEEDCRYYLVPRIIENIFKIKLIWTKPQNCDLLIVGWGSSRGVIEEVVRKLNDQGYHVAGLHFKIIYPLPLGLSAIFSQYKHVVAVEMAYGDKLKLTPFVQMLRSETLVDIQCLISEAKGRPLKPAHVIEKAKSFLQEVTHA